VQFFAADFESFDTPDCDGRGVLLIIRRHVSFAAWQIIVDDQFDSQVRFISRHAAEAF